MEYRKTITLKDGRRCVLRSGTEEDAAGALGNYNRAHGETDYLLTLPEECTRTVEAEARFLNEIEKSAGDAELLAEVDGAVVATAGIHPIGARIKIRHRAGFGISVEKAFWSLGIGRALTRACIECAHRAGYAQLELEAVAENPRAIALYESEGFREYGRNPMGFLSPLSGRQELVLMRLELNGERSK